MTIDEMKEKLSLTPEQEKAFAAFKRAVKQSEKTGIKFYTVLESIHALNGKHLERIVDSEDLARNAYPHDEDCLLSMHNFSPPYVFNLGFSGWADDEHFAILKRD